jgi:uncharacterized protein
MRYFLILMLAALAGAGCGSRETGMEDLETRIVTAPGGEKIVAEVKIRAEQMKYGMMFRDALPKGRGMLFIHSKPGAYTYWMHNVRIPLDIIFMDSARTVTGVALNSPPCLGEAATCPHFGGNPNTLYVLEIGGGESKRLGIRPGTVLSF